MKLFAITSSSFFVLSLALGIMSPSTVFAKSAPVPGASYEHAPFGGGACGVCHERDDAANPGKIIAPVNKLCLDCHTDFAALFNSAPHIHEAAYIACTNCHNPHNGMNDKFLYSKGPSLCLTCHTKIQNTINKKVKHGAVDTGGACMDCHNPHATKVEKLLKALPFDLCVNCHNNGEIKDHNGKKLVNIKQLIETRPNQHGPVAAKDCSSCHNPHGSDNFRILVDAYPEKFYSPFEPDNYKLCFTCHDPGLVSVPQTDNITGFRDKKQNLHYLHVNRDWGRTCRACHEVHAAEKIHIIRDSVPYGNSGWNLKINYEPTANGGRCAKTCHTTKEYSRK